MSKRALICIALSVCAQFVSGDVQFTCPTAPITNVTVGGNLPLGATQPIVVPKNTNCTFNFQVPNGYKLSLSLSANFIVDNDTVAIIDNLGHPYTLTHSGQPIKNAVIWIAAGSGQIQVVGTSGQSTFMTQYAYSPLSNYVKVNVKTGEFFPLSKVTGNNAYTITSKNMKKIIATVGRENTVSTDSTLENIYVYDGDNLITAKMIGRLSNLGFQNKQSSSNTSLTLVNFYGTSSTSWVVANDASTVQNYWRYSVIITSLGSNVRGNLSNVGGVSAFTFYCTDCKEMYLNEFKFDSLKTFNTGGVTLQGQAPTHGMGTLISYPAMTTTQSQFPQYIQSGMFTMVIKTAGIYMSVSSSNIATGWQKPVKGRKGYVFSANLWDPSAAPKLSATFSNDSTLFNYTLKMDKLTYGNKQFDTLSVKIGPTNGGAAVDNKYPRDTSSTGIVSANGNFMTLNYDGSAGSDIRLSFEMEEVSGSAMIGFLTTVLVALYHLL